MSIKWQYKPPRVCIKYSRFKTSNSSEAQVRKLCSFASHKIMLFYLMKCLKAKQV